MKLINSFVISAIACIGLAACNSPAPPEPQPAVDAPAAETPVASNKDAAGHARSSVADGIGEWGIDVAEISRTVEPGDDFFVFVNEGWLQRSEIPAGFSRFGAFAELSLEAEERVASIVADAAESNAEAGDPRQQIGAVHAAFMDTATIEQRGLEPIQERLDALIGISVHDEVAL
ncbi:MAG: M13 family metallopeptidase, partial [Xanthomonadaceae bacterium]|nr:M13 family metallopeptidase [Xanthomonadaceae bacterium]